MENNETQKMLADALGESRETIKHWENGTRHIKAESIIEIAKHFNVSCDYLLGVSETRSIKEDVQIVTKTIGLSESAIKNIIYRGPVFMDALNYLLESDAFWDMVRCMDMRYIMGSYTSEVIASYTKDTEYENITTDRIDRLACSDCLNTLITGYWEHKGSPKARTIIEKPPQCEQHQDGKQGR